jgi:hypothetical protein
MLLLAPTALSGEVRTGDSVWLAPDEVLDDDLYVTATTFVLDGIVHGDVMFGGRNLTVNGTIDGDLMAGGQSLTINGTVTDDVRMGGAAMVLGHEARIGDDVSVAGYSFEARQGSVVEGAVGFGGRQAVLAGTIDEDALIAAYGLELSGTVAGNVEAEVAAPGTASDFDPSTWMPGMPSVPTVEAGLEASETAVIGGNLELTTNRIFRIPQGLVAGETLFEETDSFLSFRQNPVVTGFRRYIALAAIGLMLLWLVPGFLRRSAVALETKPGPSLGFGAIMLFGVPLAVLLLGGIVLLAAILFGTITLGDLSFLVATLGASLLVPILLVFILSAVYLTQILVGYLCGRWVLTRFGPEGADSPVWALLVGLLIVVLLATIPYVGPVSSLAVSLFGLGSLWVIWRQGRTGLSDRPTSPPQTVSPSAS